MMAVLALVGILRGRRDEQDSRVEGVDDCSDGIVGNGCCCKRELQSWKLKSGRDLYENLNIKLKMKCLCKM